MIDDKKCIALIELVDVKQKDVFFKVNAIINAKGYLDEGLQTPVSVGETIRVEETSILKNLEGKLGKDWKTKNEIIETKISLVEKDGFLNKYKICKLDIDNYGIKKVKYLFNAKWLSNNLFMQPNKQIINQLERHNLIPIDFTSKIMFDEIKQVDGIIYPSQQNTSEIKSYSIEEDYRFIPLSSRKDEYCITEKAFRDIKPTTRDGKAVELWGRNELKEWLCDNLLKTKKEKGLIDTFLQELDLISAENEEQFEYRLQRCKRVFKENYFSQQDVNYFQRKMRQEDLKKIGEQMLKETKNEIEKSLEKDRQRKIEEVDKEVEEYREAAIFAKTKEQENELKEINSQISEKKERLACIENIILSKTEELSELNSILQSKTLELININEQKLEIKLQHEEVLSKLFETLDDKLFSIKKNTEEVGTSLEREEFFPMVLDAETLDEDEEYFKIISAKIDTTLKKELVEPIEYFASIIPNISYVYVLAHFVGNCHVKTITVEHGWFHFDDFRKAGLVEFWNKALAFPNDNFILVLQNINMIPIRSALQPLIDIISGSCFSMPGALENQLPKNIRIIGTILPAEGKGSIGLPLDEASYCPFKFIGKPEDVLPLPLSELLELHPKRQIKFAEIAFKRFEEIDNNGFTRYAAY